MGDNSAGKDWFLALLVDSEQEMSDTLLLPTARIIAPELQAEFGSIPPALIPLEGVPAFQRISEQTWKQGGRVVLAAHDGAALIDEYLARHSDLAVITVDVGPTSSLGETILRGIERSGLGDDRLVVNFADTFVGDVPASGDVICFQRQPDTHRWTTFSFDEHGNVSGVVDKDTEKMHDEAPVFVGVFAFTDIEGFVAALHEALVETHLTYDPFYQALLIYAASHNMQMHETASWYDFGHLDTYYATRQQFFLNHRAFNSVKVDARRGVIRKTSDDTRKLANEISWYVGLPKNLSALAPRVLDYSLDAHKAFVDMEFYGYPPLAESYLHGAWDSGVWHQVFRTLGETMTLMQSERTLVGKGDAARRSALLQNMYINKTVDRLQAIAGDETFAAMVGEYVTINGAQCLGVKSVLSTLVDIIDASRICESECLSVVHGDFCLSNILFDRRTSIVRLIDPRGSFGSSFSIYGDPLYDLAKLAHSIHGDYDHFVHNLFDLRVTDSGVYFDAHITARQKLVKRQFEHWMQQTAASAYTKVCLIESLLFLSKVPLHADHPRAQMAFLARGLEFYTSTARRLGRVHPHSELSGALSELSEEYV